MATDFTPRPTEDLVPLDFSDRRRLVVCEVLMRLEHDDVVAPATWGQAVLHNVASETEVVEMGDQALHRLHQILGHRQ